MNFNKYSLVKDYASWFDYERNQWVSLLQQAKGLPKEVSLRLRWFIYYHSKAKGNVSLTCRYFGIARKTFYKWFNRFDENNLMSLTNKSTRPHRVRQKEISIVQENRIISLRKQYIRMGKDKLKILYQHEYGESISTWKIQGVIQKYQLYYNKKKASRTRRKRLHGVKKKRITELKKQPRGGFLLQIDTIVKYLNNRKFYILTAIDNVSKIAYARMYTSHSSRTAVDFLKRLNYLLDGQIENVLTDNGSEFAGYFSVACAQLGFNHYHSRLRTPKDNAVNERFNRTLREEFMQLGNFTPKVDTFNKNLTNWLVFYNFKRPHQSLNYLTPISFSSQLKYLYPIYPASTPS